MFRRKPIVLTPEQMEEIRTKDFFDMILPGNIKFFSDHYIIGDWEGDRGGSGKSYCLFDCFCWDGKPVCRTTAPRHPQQPELVIRHRDAPASASN